MHVLFYGGTFDPIHHGHLITCRRARELLNAHAVLLVPAAVSPHKTHAVQGASAEHRLAMLQLAVENDPRFRIDPRELSRPGPSYTIDTVESILAESAGLRITLLLGADQLGKFQTWERVARLVELADVAILPRPGIDLAHAMATARARLPHLRMNDLNTPSIDISATDIRNRTRTGLPISYLVPPAVGAYIHRHKLYV